MAICDVADCLCNLAGRKCLELIIGREGSKDARDLLKSFDLTICKSAFDGRLFRIPFPHDTFNLRSLALAQKIASVVMNHPLTFCARIRSKIEAPRYKVVNEFVQASRAGMDCSKALGKIAKNAWQDVGMPPPAKQAGPFESANAHQNFLCKLLSRWQVTTICFDVVTGVPWFLLCRRSQIPALSDWSVLVPRQKYALRGVQVLDPPIGALECEVPWPMDDLDDL